MASIRIESPFIGRERELARLSELLTAAQEGAAAAALIAGDAGVGKTRATAELVRRAEASGVLVLTGHCVDLGAGLPYLPFAEALSELVRPGGREIPGAPDVVRSVLADRPVLARLAGAVADPVQVDGPLERLPLFDAVATLLTALTRQVAPVLLVIEDLHWADASSRDLLRFLLARLSADRLLVIATYRADDLHRAHPLRPLLAELVRLPRVERIDLPPFDEAELRRYLAALNGSDVPESVVRAILARSEGNAYYAEELLAAGGTGQRLPAALADVLLARVERLPVQAQHLVRVAAVGGSRVRDRLLRLACGLDPDGAEQAMRDAVAHHILVPDGVDRLAFRHALLQEAVYADLLPGERARLHAGYARLLAQEPDRSVAAELARHSLAANDLRTALTASIQAAEEALARFAPAEALAHYERALQLWEAVDEAQHPAEPDLLTLSLRAASAAGGAGAFARAAGLAAEACALADRSGDAESAARAHMWLAHHLFALERADEARAEATRSIQLLEGTGPSPIRVWAAALEARLIAPQPRLQPLAVIEPALAEARLLGLADGEADLLISLARAETASGDTAAAAEHLAQARTRAAEAGDAESVLRATFSLAAQWFDAADLAKARDTAREALADATKAGLSTSVYGLEARGMLILALVLAGEWDEALDVVAEGRVITPEQEVPRWLMCALPILVARDPAEGQRAALAMLDWLDEYGVNVHMVLGAQADALTWLGDPPAAVRAVQDGLARQADAGEPLHLGGIQLCALGLAALADQADQARLRGDDVGRERALALGREWLAHARTAAEHGEPRTGSLGPEGVAWLRRAEAEFARLAGGGQVPAWTAAVDAFDYGDRYERARSRWRLAEALAVAGDLGQAGAQAAQARAEAQALQARPLREAVDALARRTRLDLGGGVAELPVLTPREQEVMLLVAEGLTNRQIGQRLFISEKTASVHVSNVLGKLRAGSRTEAVAIAYRRGLISGTSGVVAQQGAGAS